VNDGDMEQNHVLCDPHRAVVMGHDFKSISTAVFDAGYSMPGY
jgi:hypothetical protein